jgi:hypothetical protein
MTPPSSIARAPSRARTRKLKVPEDPPVKTFSDPANTPANRNHELSQFLRQFFYESSFTNLANLTNPAHRS